MIAIPTTEELYNDIVANLEAEFQVSISQTGKVYLRAFAAVQAAKMKQMYLMIAKVQKNIFVDTADPETKGGTLERWGRVKLGRNPFPPVNGQYELTVSGDVGAIIPASTTFKSDDDALSPGILYILDNAYELQSNPDTIIVRALTAGLEGKLNPADTLTATSPIANVDSSASVSDEVIQPLAAEDIEDYREKTEESFRLEPQGGAGPDFRIWSQDAQGVEKVYPYAKSNATAEVDLYVEATIADSQDGAGTPTQDILDDVESVIEFDPDATIGVLEERGRRPLGVWQVNVLPITVKLVDITIVGFTGVTASQQALILAALTKELSRTRPFVASCDLLAEKNDILDNNKVTGVIYSQIPGAIYSGIIIEIDGVVMSSYTFLLGFIPKLNSVSYA